MAVERWPDILPGPLSDDYGVEPGEGTIRTDMESGPARQDEIFTDVPAALPVKWLFSGDEYSVFAAWYVRRARQGATWFAVTLAMSTGIGEVEARFVNQYKAKRQGILWLVTAKMEVRDPPIYTAEELDVVLEILPGALHRAVGRIDWSLGRLVGASRWTEEEWAVVQDIHPAALHAIGGDLHGLLVAGVTGPSARGDDEWAVALEIHPAALATAADGLHQVLGVLA